MSGTIDGDREFLQNCLLMQFFFNHMKIVRVPSVF